MIIDAFRDTSTASSYRWFVFFFFLFFFSPPPKKMKQNETNKPKYWIRWCWMKPRITVESVAFRSLCWPNPRRTPLAISCRKCGRPAHPIVLSPASWRYPKCCCWATWPSENPLSSTGTYRIKFQRAASQSWTLPPLRPERTFHL